MKSPMEGISLGKKDVGSTLATTEEDRKCQCPTRTRPPEPPPMEENVPMLKQLVSYYYASSDFNTCTHQFLPLVESLPPLRLLVDPTVTPKAVHKPAQVPIHFVDEVKAGLEKDIRLGVLERVPENTPVTWCSRMCVVVKKNGSPRWMVDFKAVNNAAPRQTHPVIPLFQQAASVPTGTYKTCLDAWEGYHSIPI